MSQDRSLIWIIVVSFSLTKYYDKGNQNKFIGWLIMEDKRCCGRGTCIINAEGVCWCGQRWDGEKMISANSDINKTKELDKKELPKK